MGTETLARWRVPLGWGLGLSALALAKPEPGWLLAGMAIAALGEALRLWASGHLLKDRRLTTSGPYAWTRNPLYLGSLLLGVGFCLAAGRALLLVPLAVLFALVYVPVMKREAKKLGEGYPGDYTRYADEVPLFLPRLPRPPRLRPGSSEDEAFSWNKVRSNREHWTVAGVLVAAALLWAKWGLSS